MKKDNRFESSLYAESVRRTAARLNRELYLGRGTHTGRLFYARPDDYLQTHLHLIGASNFGKSFYLEHLLREYTNLGIPASIIDPHGDLAKHYYEWLTQNPRLRREQKIIYFAPGAAHNGIGFNPFDCGLAEPAEVASLVLEAFFKVWGAESFNETPRLERTLRIMFHTFAENGIPLTRAYEFLLVDNISFRRTLLANVADVRVRQSWEEIEKLPKGEKLVRFESSWNRLQRFLSTPSVARIFADDQPVLDFPGMLSRGEILVANLSRLHSTEAQSLVGTMIVNALYHAAKCRPEGRRRHWVLGIDEFPQFVTTDIARSLDQLRKFGVRLILAHQHLAQLPPDLLGSVRTNAKIKVVFGGLSRPDAEILARELFTGDVRGDRVKHITYQTKFRPVLAKREVEGSSESITENASESEGWSESTSFARSDGWSEGSSRGESETQAESLTERPDGQEADSTVSHALSTTSSYTDSQGSTESETHGESSGRSGSRSTSRGVTRGSSRSTQFVTEHEEFREETGRQYWPLEEQWEILTARIMNLNPREALVKVLNKPVIDITTPEIRHLPSRRRRKPVPPARNAETERPEKESAGPNGDLPADFRE